MKLIRSSVNYHLHLPDIDSEIIRKISNDISAKTNAFGSSVINDVISIFVLDKFDTPELKEQIKNIVLNHVSTV